MPPLKPKTIPDAPALSTTLLIKPIISLTVFSKFSLGTLIPFSVISSPL